MAWVPFQKWPLNVNNIASLNLLIDMLVQGNRICLIHQPHLLFLNAETFDIALSIIIKDNQYGQGVIASIEHLAKKLNISM